MKKKQNQQSVVIGYINQNGSITAKEAMDNLGIMRLASRINDLKKEGYAIKSTRIPVHNRFGETCWVARYTLM